MKKKSYIIGAIIFAMALAAAFLPIVKNGCIQAAAIASELGEVLNVRTDFDKDGEFYIVDSTAYGGSEIVVSNGKIWGINSKKSKVAVDIEQTDFLGNTVIVPIEHQVEDETNYYFLSDFTRNIYLYDCSGSLGGTNPEAYMSDDGKFDDGMAITVYDTLLDAYDFYSDESNIGVSWKGISGKNDDEAYNAEENEEVELLVYIHFGNKYENANCGYDRDSGFAIMQVGDGAPNGVLYNQGKAKDVIGHEYQHAITDFAASGGNGIVYLNESGAISEAVSDIFGMLIEGYETDDERFWIMGEDALSYEGNLRSAIGGTEASAYHVSDEMPLCYQKHNHEISGCDSGNTHGNSTILTHAQYRMYERMPEFFTKQNIGKLWFATLGHLSYRSDFSDFASAMIAAAEEIDFPQAAREVVRSCLFERGLIESENAHVLTFYDDESNVIEKISVEHGGDVAYPVLPDKEPTYDGYYAFVGWAGKTSNVTEDGDLFPIYQYVSYTHKVTFRSDNEIIATVSVHHGDKAECPFTPSKQSDLEYNYTFIGWDQDVSCVLENMDVNAMYQESFVDYYITFFDGDKLLDKRSAHYGEKIDSFFTPTRSGYTFVGWDYDGEKVSELEIQGNVALNAVWRLATWVIITITASALVLITAVIIIVIVVVKKRYGR